MNTIFKIVALYAVVRIAPTAIGAINRKLDKMAR